MYSRLLSFRFVAALLVAFLMVTGLQSGATAATKRYVSVSATPAVGVVGTYVTFSGRVTRSPRGTVVVVERKVGRKWVKARATRTVNKAGRYAVRVVRPKKVANYTYRVRVAKKGRLRATRSRAVRVTALRRTYASLSATPGSTTAGSAITLGGTVFPFRQGTPVSLQRRSGTTWVTIARTSVSANGTFARSVTPSTTTIYRALVARAGGNAPASSNQRTVAAKPLITTTALGQATRFSSYTAQLATYGNQVGTWSATGLPSGLSLDPATGTITGAPTIAFTGETENVNVTIGFRQTSTGLVAATKVYTLVVKQAGKPVITTSSLPNGTRGVPYQQTLMAQGDPVGTWTATPLPAGLSLDPSTGVISGTPTTVGDTQVVVGFTQDGTGREADPQTITLTIDAPAAPVITTDTLPNGTIGTPYSGQLEAQGDPTGTWTASPLPAGLDVDEDTGAITGTPTGPDGDTDVVVGFTQTSTGVAAAPKTITLRIGPADAPRITTTALPNAVRFADYQFQLVADSAGTWSKTGDLPAGLSLSAAGVISGTPSETGDFPVTFQFSRTSPAGQTTKTLTLHVDQAPAPVISTSSLPNGDRFQAYSTTLAATGPLSNGTTGAVSGTWTATPLPAGLTLNQATGAITGTPSAAGTTQVQIGFTQTNTGRAATPKTLTLVVNQAPAPVISTTDLPDGTRTLSYSTTLTAQGNPVGTWTASPLPDGLSLDPSTGVISGTPTVEGDTEVTIGFTQTSTGLSATPKTLTLHVEPFPMITTADPLPQATPLAAYNVQLQVAPAMAGEWTLVSGAPPIGITLKKTGQLSGAATLPGNTTFTVRFTATATGYSTTKTFHLKAA